MPLTIGDCIMEARRIAQDTVEPYRFGENDAYMAFTLAMTEARKARPDLFATRLFDEPVVYTIDNAGDPFPIWAVYATAVSYFIVGRFELREDQFNNDGRASRLLATFKAQLSTAVA